MNAFTYNGKKSSDFGLYISGDAVFNVPERDVSRYQVYGRNGDIILDNGRYENVTVTYPVFVARDSARQSILAVNAWLLSDSGYHRLEDDYNPEYFRLACSVEAINWTVTRGRYADSSLSFLCKPQRFLKSGEKSITVTSGDVISNLQMFTAKPLIRVEGTGTITIGNNTLTVNTAGDQYIDIDCDSMNCYEGSNNRNSRCSGSFPVLSPGSNSVVYSDFTSVTITPRWWTL